MLQPTRSARGSRWAVGSATLAVWMLAALTSTYWGLHIAGSGSRLSAAPVVLRQPEAPDPAAIARLLGAAGAAADTQAAPALASRFVLTGVVAGATGAGAALIAVDGRPPKPFTVGSPVEAGLVLQSVQGRRASLGPASTGPAALTLELPPLPQ